MKIKFNHSEKTLSASLGISEERAKQIDKVKNRTSRKNVSDLVSKMLDDPTLSPEEVIYVLVGIGFSVGRMLKINHVLKSSKDGIE